MCVCVYWIERKRLKEEGRCKNICIILPPNICPIITGTTSRLTNHSSITGVTDCVQQTGGLLIGSCYDLADGESSLNCESQSKVTHSTLRAWQHNKNLKKNWNNFVSICWPPLPSSPSFCPPSSILSASMSVPGLSDLAWCPQNPLLCSMDHREWKPPVGHRRSRAHCVGEAP